MNYYFAYLNTIEKKLHISVINVKGDGIIHLMNSTDLNAVKLYCIGYIQGQNYSNDLKVIATNNILEFSDNHTFIGK